MHSWWEVGALYWALTCKAVWAPWSTHSRLPSAKWLTSVRTSQLLSLKREIKWASFFEAIVFLYKSPTPWTGEEGGGSLLQTQLTFRQQLIQKLSLSFSTFLFPSAICSHWLFKQHPVPPRCVPFKVFLLLFVTVVWSYVFSANALLPSLPDAVSFEALSSHMCVLICACFAMCLCSGGWFLLFQLPDLGKALTAFFTCNLCGKVAAVFPSFSKA